MDETTALVPTEMVPTMHVVARNAEEMAAARQRVSLWLSNKLALIASEVAELSEAIDQLPAGMVPEPRRTMRY